MGQQTDRDAVFVADPSAAPDVPHVTACSNA
jgi:hypothetical protein